MQRIFPCTVFCKIYLHPHPSVNSPRWGGKNSSIGNLKELKSSQGFCSVAVVHSFVGTQKSIAGIRSWTFLSIFTIVNIPSETKTFRSFDGTTSSSPKQPQIDSGMLDTSQQQQQHFSCASTILAESAIGSTTSVKDPENVKILFPVYA